MRHNQNIVTSGRNKVGDATPIHLAAQGGHAKLVEFLLHSGASAQVEDGVIDSILCLRQLSCLFYFPACLLDSDKVLHKLFLDSTGILKKLNYKVI